MKKKEKIELDFDFLEKKSNNTNSPKSVSSENSKSHTYVKSKQSKTFNFSDRTKKWLVGFAVVGVIILIGVLGGDSDTGTSNTNNASGRASQYDNEMIQTGEYSCSRYHHDRAGELEPTSSEEAIIDSNTDQLQLESKNLDSEGYAIDNMYVDQYSQWSIDQYNNRVDNFNAELESYQRRASAHERSIDNYNARVEAYNNYLISNCTPSR